MDKKSKNIFLLFAVFTLFVVLFSSCYKTDIDKISDDFEWNPDISVALGETIATMKYNEDEYINNRLYDTITFSISDIIADRENIVKLMLRLNMENEFPIQWRMSLYYVTNDEKNLLTGPIDIAAGKVDQDTGESTIPNKMSPKDILLDSVQIDGLYNSSMLVISLDSVLSVNPVDSDIEYRFFTQIGLQAKLHIVYE